MFLCEKYLDLDMSIKRIWSQLLTLIGLGFISYDNYLKNMDVMWQHSQYFQKFELVKGVRIIHIKHLYCKEKFQNKKVKQENPFKSIPNLHYIEIQLTFVCCSFWDIQQVQQLLVQQLVWDIELRTFAVDDQYVCIDSFTFVRLNNCGVFVQQVIYQKISGYCDEIHI